MFDGRTSTRLLIAALALLTAAFLWPAEEAVNGQGLHWTVLWLMLAAACSWCGQRSASPQLSHCWPDAADLGVVLIVLGHVVSTAGVFSVEGDRRSALNLTFEWMGILAAWYCWRKLFSLPAARAGVAGVVLGMSVGLAAFGIWQHAVFYPREAGEYVRMRTALDASIAGGRAAESAALLSEFRQRGYPVDGAERVLFENRLLSSSEPFATFVLANTLGGVLAAAMVLLLSVARGAQDFAGYRWWHWLLWIASASLIGWCLVLTKSRSAWAGALCGVALLVFLRHRTKTGMRLLRGVLLGVAAVLVVGAVAGLAGAIDKEVISESPRSLQFRLLYWTGTLRMLREQPVLGAGPGNFRSSYLPHKSAESSEEIRDPHNLFLDAWSSGGLCALAGVIVVVAATLRTAWQKPPAVDGPVSSMTALLSGPGVASGFTVGLALHATWSWIHGAAFGLDQAPHLLLVAGAALVMTLGHGLRVSVDGSAGVVMFVALLIHLLGSGGFQTPTVMLLLLGSAALAVTGPANGVGAVKPVACAIRTSGARGRAASAVAFAGAVVVLWWGVIPVDRVDVLLGEATARLELDRSPDLAAKAVVEAVAADPIAVAPRQRRVEIATYQLLALQAAMISTGRTSGVVEAGTSPDLIARIQEGLEACGNLIAADRRSLAGYKQRAELRTLAWSLLQNPDDLAAAVADQETVVTFHPTAVLEWLELARLYDLSSGDEADQRSESAAQRALELEAVNHAWGHRDQWLTAEQTKLLKQLQAE